MSSHLSLVTLWHVWVSFSGWLEHRFSDILVFSLVKFLTDGSPKLLPGSQLREGTGVVLLQSVKVHAASIPTWNVHEDAPPLPPSFRSLPSQQTTESPGVWGCEILSTGPHTMPIKWILQVGLSPSCAQDSTGEPLSDP